MSSISNWFKRWWKTSGRIRRNSSGSPNTDSPSTQPPRHEDKQFDDVHHHAHAAVTPPIWIRPFIPGDEAVIHFMCQHHPDVNWFARNFLVLPGLHWERCLVAEANGEICGFVFHSLAGDTRHIHYLFVTNAYRRLGIGRLLIERFAVESVRSSHVHKVTAIVPGSDQRASKFFRALHFKTSDIRQQAHEDSLQTVYVLDCPGEAIRHVKLTTLLPKTTPTPG